MGSIGLRITLKGETMPIFAMSDSRFFVTIPSPNQLRGGVASRDPKRAVVIVDREGFEWVASLWQLVRFDWDNEISCTMPIYAGIIASDQLVTAYRSRWEPCARRIHTGGVLWIFLHVINAEEERWLKYWHWLESDFEPFNGILTDMAKEDFWPLLVT